MIVYEVSLAVDAEILDEFLPWLRHHVDAMTALDGFLGADVWRVTDPVVNDRAVFCCAYRLASREALDRYFELHADDMRADGLQRFPDRFSATRRILEPVTRPDW